MTALDPAASAASSPTKDHSTAALPQTGPPMSPITAASFPNAETIVIFQGEEPDESLRNPQNMWIHETEDEEGTKTTIPKRWNPSLERWMPMFDRGRNTSAPPRDDLAFREAGLQFTRPGEAAALEYSLGDGLTRIAVEGPAGRVLQMHGLTNIRFVRDGETVRVLFDHKEHQ